MLLRILIQRKAGCNRFPRVLLFPEGTTTNGRALISFQLGAFIPGYAIQPVVVRYPHVHFDQSWYNFHFYQKVLHLHFSRSWPVLLFIAFIVFRGNISLARLMFRMFTQFHNFMEVLYDNCFSVLALKFSIPCVILRKHIFLMFLVCWILNFLVGFALENVVFSAQRIRCILLLE